MGTSKAMEYLSNNLISRKNMKNTKIINIFLSLLLGLVLIQPAYADLRTNSDSNADSSIITYAVFGDTLHTYSIGKNSSRKDFT